MRASDPAAAEHRVTLEVGEDEALAAVEEAVEAWGADWSRAGGRLEMPASAGLRSGWLRGQLWVERAAGGSAVVLRVEESTWRLRTKAVIVLLIATAGAVPTLIWPFFPRLLPLVPVGLILALGAWFLVVSRLVTSGPEELLALVADLAAEGEGDEDEEPEPT